MGYEIFIWLFELGTILSINKRCAAANSRHYDAHVFEIKTKVFAPLLLARENWSFIAPKATALFAETLCAICRSQVFVNL